MSFNVNFNQLNVFYIASQCSSFKEAAMHLNLSTPAVSIQIKNFEESLGFKLFIRNGSSLNLTKEGKELLPYAKKIFERIDSFNSKASRMIGEETNHIVIALHSSSAEILSPLLYEYIKEHLPWLNVVFVTLNYQTYLDKLRESEITLVIKAGEFPNDIRVQEFIEFEVPFVVSPDNPVIADQPISMKKLRSLQLIAPPMESEFSKYIHTFYKENNISLSSQDSQMIASAAAKFIQKTNCGAYLSSLHIEEELAEGKLVKLKVEKNPKNVSFYIGYIEESLQNKHIKNLLELLKNKEKFKNFKSSISKA